MESHGEKSKDGRIEVANNESSSIDLRLHVHDAIPRYSEKEAQDLAKKLANKESFRDAQKVLITWFERGECKDNNSASFLSLIELCSDFLKKLKMEQKECLQAVKNAEKNFAEQNHLIQCDLDKIGSVFESIDRESIWDNFTQIERNNLKMMKKDLLGLKHDNLMDVVKGKKRKNSKNVLKELQTLMQQCNSLTSKLDSLHKEAEDLKTRKQDDEREILRLKEELKRINFLNINSECSPDYVRQKEVYIIYSLSLLLVEHYPSGVNLDYIHTYLRSSIPTISVGEIEMLLRSKPTIFEEVGHGTEKTWTCVCFSRRDPRE